MSRIEIPEAELYDSAYKAYLHKICQKLQLGSEIEKEVSFTLDRQFYLKIPSKTSNLELLRQLIIGFVANGKTTPQVTEDISLAVDEACTNIIKHSYGAEKDGTIEVMISLSDENIVILITDSGENGQQFDPNKLEYFEKKQYLERLERGGLGIYIIKSIMDVVEYHIQPGAYNRLKMVKFLKNA